MRHRAANLVSATRGLEQQRRHPAPVRTDQFFVVDDAERGDQAFLGLAVVPVALGAQDVQEFIEARRGFAFDEQSNAEQIVRGEIVVVLRDARAQRRRHPAHP